MRWAVLAVTVLLAGCSGGKEASPDGDPQVPVVRGDEPLSGFVFDAAIQPVVGAAVSIPAVGVETVTDKQGRYGFTGLPYDMVLTVISQADGFKPMSKSLQLTEGTATRVNFTLDRVPVKTPRVDVDSFNGVINCNGVLKAAGERYGAPCGMVVQGAGVDNRVWEFRVDPDLAGLVVEVYWRPDSEFARHLNLTIETMGYGDQDRVIFSEEGESMLRGQIGVLDATRFYAGGGMVRVIVDIGRNTAADEVGVGLGLAVQQGFEVYASKFYVAPPTPSYTVGDPA